MPALTPAELAAVCRDLIGELRKGDRYFEVKCDYNVKGGADDTLVKGVVGRVEIRDDALAIIYKPDGKSYDDPTLKIHRFPAESMDWHRIEKGKVIIKDPGDILLPVDGDGEADEQDPTEAEWDQWYARYYAPYIEAIAANGGYEGGGLLVYDQLRTKLMGPVDGFNVTSNKGYRARLLDSICLWVKASVDHGEGWDDPDKALIKLGDSLLMAMRDDVQAQGLAPEKVNEIHAKIRQGNKDYDAYGKALTDVKKSVERKKTTQEAANKCGRCGRQGHYEKKCYATFHLNGSELIPNGVTPPANDGGTGTRDFRKGGRPGAKKAVTTTGV